MLCFATKKQRESRVQAAEQPGKDWPDLLHFQGKTHKPTGVNRCDDFGGRSCHGQMRAADGRRHCVVAKSRTRHFFSSRALWTATWFLGSQWRLLGLSQGNPCPQIIEASHHKMHPTIPIQTTPSSSVLPCRVTWNPKTILKESRAGGHFLGSMSICILSWIFRTQNRIDFQWVFSPSVLIHEEAHDGHLLPCFFCCCCFVLLAKAIWAVHWASPEPRPPGNSSVSVSSLRGLPASFDKSKLRKWWVQAPTPPGSNHGVVSKS